MTGQVADYFVASVSVILGAVMMLASLLDWDGVFALPKAQWLESRFGRRGARLFLGGVGAALIVLGAVIAGAFETSPPA